MGVHVFSINYRAFNTSNIIDIRNCFMKINDMN